ncbi:P-loop containing nucleoside triphosphate hydrolase protein [Fomitopsis serialis]|uniref:P-loop containing nucleoside triphosphate hydrolase protein n=1 Tax=Fomitopsis serialis TaxID=139415 RepID=UPI0020085A13|nr:P-loop containing nucleoside triphosphate hydrolase protein [Neoantrodia serialis]KAH9938315.1 P-loop containing nucleoside triphosphate hydrolase protein [Neoantrodia serialis]
MRGTKRHALTTDELMRMQELPARKKFKQQIVDPDHSDGEESIQGHVAASRSESGPSSELEGSDGEEDAEGQRLDDDEENEEDSKDTESSEEEQYAPPTNWDDADSRFGLSRMTVVSRSSKPTQPEAPKPARTRPTSFESLGISSALLNALTKMSIKSPTEIQAACIPPLLAGEDCIGNAKTGSGKTIAFALPILQRLAVDPYGIFALVLTPTRELAFQISEQFAVLGSALNLRTAVVVGGMDMMAQAIELGHRPHVVVATPGRIVDLLKSCSGEWDLSRIKFLVLDEADRLLTPTFAPELSYLFETLPKERQTCLFTATLTPAVETLANTPPRPGKQKPYVHRMTESVETVETLQQHYILVPSQVRESYLFYLLCNPPESTVHLRRAPPEPVKPSKKGKATAQARSRAKKPKPTSADAEEIEQPPPTIIFCRRPRTAAYLTALLQTLRIRATALHSRLTQRERLSSLALFRASVVPVLVSTDVGARGLDVEDVALVVNWDMPDEPEEYTHRVGRTARKGKGGVAVSFVTERDEERVGEVLEKLNAVSTAKRLANMELHDSDFGKREEIYKIKSAKRRADVEASRS